MKRREFLARSMATAAGFGAVSSSLNMPVQGDTGQPNIVVIVADDAGWNDLGYHGSEILTPNIDMMAKSGVQLDSFYVYPVCSPTRAALMTGRPPSRFGINGPLQYKDGRGLPAGTVTVAEVLRRAGYDTAICGKWHLGMEPEFIPNNYGFNYSYGYVGPWIDSYTHLTTDFKDTMDGIRQWHRNGELIDEPGHVTDLITDDAIEFITHRRDSGKPFFLYVPYSAPHVPCQEETEWVAPYDGIIENTSRKYFAAAMTHMDDSIGRILATLRDEKIEENTLVVFFSDNGGQKGGEYSAWLVPPAKFYMSYGATDMLGDNTPLRDWKGQLYEGGIRVPALMYHPGTLAPSKVTAPMTVCDLFPTLAAYAGTEVPAAVTVEGADVMPEVTGARTGVSRTLYWKTNWAAVVRSGDWKLLHKGRRLDEGVDELYDLAHDPYEKNNIAASHPDIVKTLRDEMIRLHRDDK